MKRKAVEGTRRSSISFHPRSMAHAFKKMHLTSHWKLCGVSGEDCMENRTCILRFGHLSVLHPHPLATNCVRLRWNVQSRIGKADIWMILEFDLMRSDFRSRPVLIWTFSQSLLHGSSFTGPILENPALKVILGKVSSSIQPGKVIRWVNGNRYFNYLIIWMVYTWWRAYVETRKCGGIGEMAFIFANYWHFKALYGTKKS